MRNLPSLKKTDFTWQILILYEKFTFLNCFSRSIADDLKVGKAVMPQMYACATVLFSDIRGFTRISSMSTPFQIVQFLNDMFSGFDAIIATHDAYKVETIGKCIYMIMLIYRKVMLIWSSPVYRKKTAITMFNISPISHWKCERYRISSLIESPGVVFFDMSGEGGLLLSRKKLSSTING